MTLDEAFSKFVRLRDAIRNDLSVNVFGRCSTCSKKILIWDFEHGYNPFAHCGHFINRTHGSVRHNPKNGHLQCTQCNTVEGGKQKEMAAYIDRKHGKGTAEALFLESKSLIKLFPFEKEELKVFYKKEIKRMEKELGIV